MEQSPELAQTNTTTKPGTLPCHQKTPLTTEQRYSQLPQLSYASIVPISSGNANVFANPPSDAWQVAYYNIDTPRSVQP